jgi:DNA-binding MarR family transcriptional regulator/GNAT superfamily N-acetyltransferase
MPIRDRERRIAAVRRFNRFYTRQLDVLRKTYLDSPYSLGEARVLYEIASGDAPTASDISRALDLDAGYLSRTLRNFEKRGLIARKASASDARQSHLALSPNGRKAFAPLERRSQQDSAAMLEKLSRRDQDRLIAAISTIEKLLGGAAEHDAAPERQYILRAPTPGDFGWIVKRHAELYGEEYGWIAPFEGVCAQIVADFVNTYDAKRERCWIAEMNGENVGSIMLAKENESVARIRLLLVDPKARGLGLGTRLTEESIRFARRAGYKKITLWTHRVLSAARHIYQKTGFKLMRSERHRRWGRAVVSEHWDLDLSTREIGPGRSRRRARSA